MSGKEDNMRDGGNALKTSGGSSGTGKDEKILLEIREFPLVKKPFLSVIVTLLIFAVSAMSYYFFENMFVPIFVFVFLVITNASFFMPSRYVFTEEKCSVDRIVFRKSYPWGRFKSYLYDKNGVYLSPLSNPERFDRFRGVFFVMGQENRKLLKPVLEDKIRGFSEPAAGR